MKKVLCLVLVLCMVLAVVPVLAERNMAYVYENNAAYLTKYEGSDEEVVIDSVADGYEVKVIGEGAFLNCESVKKVIIPETVTTIGQGAFDNCPSLEEIIIPDSVTYIETGAFTNCPNFKKVVIGNGIKSVKLETFKYCGIENLVVLNPETTVSPSGFYSVYTHGRELKYWHPGSFESCRIGTIYAPSGSKAEKYAIECKINFVPLDAVAEKPFVIDEFLNEIELLAIKKGFKTYKNGSSFAVQNGTDYLAISNGEIAYMKNGYLVKEKLVAYPEDAIEVFFGIVLDGKTITEFIAEDTFVIEEAEDCVVIKGLKNNDERIVIPGILKGKKVKISEKAFANCKSIKSVTVGEGISELPVRCFLYAENLKEINLPDSLTLIGVCCFYSCDSLEEINIKNVTVIDDFAFEYCDNLKRVTHNSHLEKIGNEAFGECYKLAEIDLSCVKIFESCAFKNCNSLTKVTLLSIEKWEGITDNQADFETGRYYRKQVEGYHGGFVVWHGIDPGVDAVFKNCKKLNEVTVRYPDNTTGEAFPALFVNCPNIKSFTIENYQPNLARWELSNVTFDNYNGYLFVGNANENTVIYSDNWAAEEYAEKLGVKFSYLYKDMDKETSVWNDDYIITIEDIAGDLSTICLDVTVSARNSVASEDLTKTLTWDFNVEYETESGWKRDGGLDYTDLYAFRTENSKTYRLKFDIHYRGDERGYKNVRLSSDMLSCEEKYITLPSAKVIDGIGIPLSGQKFNGGSLVVSRVSLSAIIGIENPSENVLEDILGSIKFKFKDGSIKPCIEVYGKSSRSSSHIFGTENPKMYEFRATANNKVVNISEIESVIVNDVEYKLENYIQAE